MKKIISVILIAVVALSFVLTGCGNNSVDANKEKLKISLLDNRVKFPMTVQDILDSKMEFVDEKNKDKKIEEGAIEYIEFYFGNIYKDRISVRITGTETHRINDARVEYLATSSGVININKKVVKDATVAEVQEVLKNSTIEYQENKEDLTKGLVVVMWNNMEINITINIRDNNLTDIAIAYSPMPEEITVIN